MTAKPPYRTSGSEDCRTVGTSAKPRLLDLFCGGFGAGEGYRRAGFDVTGVDLVERPRPDGVTFIKGNALAFLTDHGHEFDAIHASPPCHDFTAIRPPADGTGHLLHDTLAALSGYDQPWVVENVEGARKVMPGALRLCGSEFGLGAMCADGVYRHLKRHRLFLSNLTLMGAGGCNCRGKKIAGVYGNGGEENCAARRAANGQEGGSYKLGVGPARVAMGMPWADRQAVSLAIPPAYTEFLGEQLLAAVGKRRRSSAIEDERPADERHTIVLLTRRMGWNTVTTTAWEGRRDR